MRRALRTPSHILVQSSARWHILSASFSSLFGCACRGGGGASRGRKLDRGGRLAEVRVERVPARYASFQLRALKE